jgi:hypothetical protein
MTVGCTCHDSLLFSKDLAWCSDTFRLVAGKEDHVGNPWKSIVCMYSITCIWNLVPVYSGQTFCNENVQGQGNSMKTGFHRSWRRWSSSDLWVWERCMSFMRVNSGLRRCIHSPIPVFELLGETVFESNMPMSHMGQKHEPAAVCITAFPALFSDQEIMGPQNGLVIKHYAWHK